MDYLEQMNVMMNEEKSRYQFNKFIIANTSLYVWQN